MVPRLRWPITIYEIPPSLVSQLEQKISSFSKKWLKIHRSTTDLSLYSSITPCSLPLKRLTNIQKSSKASAHLLLRDSKDPVVRNVKPSLKCGLFNIEDSVSKAEAELLYNKVVGVKARGKKGLGSFKQDDFPVKGSKDHRQNVSHMVEKISKENDVIKGLSLSLQGQWMSWCNYAQRDLSWKSLLAIPQPLLSFYLGSIYNTLPSPDNLKRWNLTPEQKCTLCSSSSCTLEHILCSCKIALNQGRITFRHDSILKLIVSSLSSFLLHKSKIKLQSLHKYFVKEGDKPKPSPLSNLHGLLYQATDWILLHDLNSDLIFPQHISTTTLRPDIVLLSNTKRSVILLELTSPSENNFSYWHTKKVEKYLPICSDAVQNNWTINLFAIEIGARGFIAESFNCCFKKLGYRSHQLKVLSQQVSDTALRSSFYIWLSRNTKTWTPPQNNPITIEPVHFSENHPSYREKSINQTSNVVTKRLYGISNKGNTCYLSAILQCFLTFHDIWATLNDHQFSISPLVHSIMKFYSMQFKSIQTIDPSLFLKSATTIITKSSGNNFNLHQQQDAAEILEYLIPIISSSSPKISQYFTIETITSIKCTTCKNTKKQTDTSNILKLAVTKSINASLCQFLKCSRLEGANKYFCDICTSHQIASIETSFSHVGEYLTIQLKRFQIEGNKTKKIMAPVRCFPESINIPIVVDNVVTMWCKYKLSASISHYGTLEAGHYTASKQSGDKWFKCDDKLITEMSPDELNNGNTYILFYKKF